MQERKETEETLKDKILKEKRKFSDLLLKYDNLRSSPLLSKEAQAGLTELQDTMKEVNSSLQKVEVIQQHWSAKVTISIKYCHIHNYMRSYNYFDIIPLYSM